MDIEDYLKNSNIQEIDPTKLQLRMLSYLGVQKEYSRCLLQMILEIQGKLNDNPYSDEEMFEEVKHIEAIILQDAEKRFYEDILCVSQ